jgi:hypothetical protein
MNSTINCIEKCFGLHTISGRRMKRFHLFYKDAIQPTQEKEYSFIELIFLYFLNSTEQITFFQFN